MKIVIVSGFITPRISPRSFRATELAKAFAGMGHDVTLMASLGKYDYTEFTNKYNVKVRNIGNPYFALTNSDGKIKTPLWKKGVVFFLNRLLEFPDICLSNLVKKTIIKENNIDLLITIAVPYPIHWGAALIKKRNFNTWISDCGDPYMGNVYSKHPFYFKIIEKWWARKTDFITVPIDEANLSYYEEFRNKIHVIPQGFDFMEVKICPYKKNKVPTFLYAGLFYPVKRDPTLFLKYLVSLKTDFRFIVYTSKTNLLSSFKSVLKDKLEIRDTIDRETLLKEMSKMDFLVNITNQGVSSQLPSKLIDYALTKRPILEITSDFSSEEKENFDLFLQGNYSGRIIIQDLEKYDVKNIAKQFHYLYKLNNA